VALIYDIGESDGISFIGMKYVEVVRLRTPSPANLAARDIICFGSQIADALRAAHATGIVHRDVKSTNL
jgi:serine/threonine protein kinase